MEYKFSVFWLLVCAAVALVVSICSYSHYSAFVGVIDLLASVVSILCGVSLAVVAVLNTPFSVGKGIGSQADETGRIQTVLIEDEKLMISVQVMFFLLLFVTISFLVCLKFLSGIFAAEIETGTVGKLFKLFTSLTAFISIFSFLWSARLPVILQRIASLRRDLSK
jgi:hypothetical protein